MRKVSRRGFMMSGRVREALLWGKMTRTYMGPLASDHRSSVILTRAVGAFGTFYELEVRSLWAFWRLHHYLAMLPPGALYCPRTEPDEDDEEDDPAFTIQYWEDVRNRVNSTTAPIGKPTE